MGTHYRILFPDEGPREEMVRLTSRGTLSEVDRLMSTYRADSEVSRFNTAEVETPVGMSDHTSIVIEKALQIGRLTHGAFDLTIGPLVELWGFGATGRKEIVPHASEVSQVAERVGMEALKTGHGKAWKSRQKLAIDLNGIAKGYAVDRLAEMLDAQAVPAYLIDIGGELRAKGRKPEGNPWLVGVERPSAGAPKIHRVVTLHDHGIATSGDYRNFFNLAGRNYTHVIDPRTFEPVNHSLASVTVMAEDTTTADAMSTALMVMGPDEGYSFAARLGVAAYFLLREDEQLVERYTANFETALVA